MVRERGEDFRESGALKITREKLFTKILLKEGHQRHMLQKAR